MLVHTIQVRRSVVYGKADTTCTLRSRYLFYHSFFIQHGLRLSTPSHVYDFHIVALWHLFQLRRATTGRRPLPATPRCACQAPSRAAREPDRTK